MLILLDSIRDLSASTYLRTAIEDEKYSSAPNPWLVAAIRPFWRTADEVLA